MHEDLGKFFNVKKDLSSSNIDANKLTINNEDTTLIIDGSLNLTNIYDNFIRQDTLFENNRFGAFESIALDNSFIIVGSPTATFSFESDIACGKLLVYPYGKYR